MNFVCIILTILAVLNHSAVEVIPVPVTFYLGDLGTAYVNSEQYLYYHITLCDKATQNFTQMEMTIALPNNPAWDTSTNGFVMAQVSTCVDSFTQQCVVSQNYAWNNGINVKAVPQIKWEYKGETDLYIRLLSGNLPTQFSLEIQPLVNVSNSYYNWTTNYPFSGSAVSKKPDKMNQYWRANAQYNVKNLQLKRFALAYCDEGKDISGIDVAVALPPVDQDGLVTVFACPQSIPAENCQQSSAKQYGWLNSIVAAFNLLQCPDLQGGQRTTKDGIYVVVEGFGGDISRDNNFTFQATTRSLTTP